MIEGTLKIIKVIDIMNLPWYYFIIYVAIGCVLLFVFDKFNIIKSKPLRYFIVIIVYNLICWGIYDIALS